MKNYLVVLLFLTLCPVATANLKFVTTTTDYADLARQIGKDKVDVHSVMKGPEDMHNILAKPTEMVALNKADLFVHSGLDAEPWRDNLLKGARNPRVMQGRDGYVDMSAGIELRDVPTGKIDRSMGDVHAYGNPHYTLNPKNMQRMTATLVKAMAAADPPNAAFYKQNAVQLVTEIADLTRELQAQFEKVGRVKVVTYHRGAWDYFAEAFGLEIVGTIEPKPSITPSPSQVRQIIQTIGDQNVKIIISGTYNDVDLAKSIADRTGAKLLVLPEHVSAVPEADSVQNMFRFIARSIVQAAEASGATTKPASGGADAH